MFPDVPSDWAAPEKTLTAIAAESTAPSPTRIMKLPSETTRRQSVCWTNDARSKVTFYSRLYFGAECWHAATPGGGDSASLLTGGQTCCFVCGSTPLSSTITLLSKISHFGPREGAKCYPMRPEMLPEIKPGEGLRLGVGAGIRGLGRTTDASATTLAINK